MKKNAFTLVEVMICLIIVALLAIVMISNLKSKNFKENSYIGAANKIISMIQDTSAKIQESEIAACPMGAFMVKVAGTWNLTFYKSDGSTAIDAAGVRDLFGKYIKYEKSVDFCSYTSYCSDTAIKGGKLPGNMYIGFKKYSSISNCPAYRMPGSDANNNAPTEYNASTGSRETAKCWGELYMDVNGTEGPDSFGKDVFVFGFDKKGLAI